MPHYRFPAYTLLYTVVLVVLMGCSPAAEGPAANAARVPPFDGKHAFELLQKQVDLGPRNPGSPGHEAAETFIQEQLKPYADSITMQDFTTTVQGKKLDLCNIIALFNPGAKKWVLLAAHWDTRPRADFEVTAEKRNTPIPGANDGASGAAVLMELARAFAKQKPDVGVYMVFFDGEDYGTNEATMFLGAKHFAQTLQTSAVVNGKPIKFEYGLLLDMVGDKNLNIYKEENSVDAAPEVVDKVWKVAQDLGYEDKFIPSVKYSISDDHISLIRAGVKCIDIIDFDYGPWHSLDDTPDKCSPKSLQIVGEVVANVVYGERAP